MKKSLLWLVVVLVCVSMVAVFSFVGCKTTTVAETTAATTVAETTAATTVAETTAAATVAVENLIFGLAVKNAQIPWFQNVIIGAENKAKELGIKVVSIDGRDDPSVFLAGIDQVIQQKANGLIVVVPDPAISPAVVDKAKQAGIPIMSQSDLLVDADGKQLAPHLGIDDMEWGRGVGKWLGEYVQKQGWLKDSTKVVKAIALRHDEATVHKLRTDGGKEELLKAGFTEDMIINAPVKKYSQEAAYDAAAAVITANPKVTNWVVFGYDDSNVVGAVRALEAAGKDKDSVACGLDGSYARAEFSKPEATAFRATMYLSSQDYSAQSVQMMYDLIVNGKEMPMITNWPPAVATQDNWKQIVKE